MSGLFDQWYYTACGLGRTGTSGYQTYSASPAVTAEEELELANIAHFFPATGTEAPLSTFGVRRLQCSGRWCIFKSGQGSADDLGRPTYYAHAFLISPAEPLPHAPFFYFDSPSFDGPLDRQQVASTSIPPPLPPKSLEVGPEFVRHLGRPAEWLESYRKHFPISFAYLRAGHFWKSGVKPILVADEPRETLAVFALAWLTIDPAKRLDLSLCTLQPDRNETAFAVAGWPPHLGRPSSQFLSRFATVFSWDNPQCLPELSIPVASNGGLHQRTASVPVPVPVPISPLPPSPPSPPASVSTFQPPPFSRPESGRVATLPQHDQSLSAAAVTDHAPAPTQAAPPTTDLERMLVTSTELLSPSDLEALVALAQESPDAFARLGTELLTLPAASGFAVLNLARIQEQLVALNTELPRLADRLSHAENRDPAFRRPLLAFLQPLPPNTAASVLHRLSPDGRRDFAHLLEAGRFASWIEYESRLAADLVKQLLVSPAPDATASDPVYDAIQSLRQRKLPQWNASVFQRELESIDLAPLTAKSSARLVRYIGTISKDDFYAFLEKHAASLVEKEDLKIDELVNAPPSFLALQAVVAAKRLKEEADRERWANDLCYQCVRLDSEFANSDLSHRIALSLLKDGFNRFSAHAPEWLPRICPQSPTARRALTELHDTALFPSALRQHPDLPRWLGAIPDEHPGPDQNFANGQPSVSPLRRSDISQPKSKPGFMAGAFRFLWTLFFPPAPENTAAAPPLPTPRQSPPPIQRPSEPRLLPPPEKQNDRGAFQQTTGTPDRPLVSASGQPSYRPPQRQKTNWVRRVKNLLLLGALLLAASAAFRIVRKTFEENRISAEERGRAEQKAIFAQNKFIEEGKWKEARERIAEIRQDRDGDRLARQLQESLEEAARKELADLNQQLMNPPNKETFTRIQDKVSALSNTKIFSEEQLNALRKQALKLQTLVNKSAWKELQSLLDQPTPPWLQAEIKKSSNPSTPPQTPAPAGAGDPKPALAKAPDEEIRKLMEIANQAVSTVDPANPPRSQLSRITAAEEAINQFAARYNPADAQPARNLLELVKKKRAADWESIEKKLKDDQHRLAEWDKMPWTAARNEAMRLDELVGTLDYPDAQNYRHFAADLEQSIEERIGKLLAQIAGRATGYKDFKSQWPDLQTKAAGTPELKDLQSAYNIWTAFYRKDYLQVASEARASVKDRQSTRIANYALEKLPFVSDLPASGYFPLEQLGSGVDVVSNFTPIQKALHRRRPPGSGEPFLQDSGVAKKMNAEIQSAIIQAQFELGLPVTGRTSSEFLNRIQEAQ